MDQPTLLPSRRVGTDTDLLPAYVPLPGLGVLPVNAFVIHAREPVLVDTGIAALRDGFLKALRALIDPAALRWIWITHADADHVGNLAAVLAEGVSDVEKFAPPIPVTEGDTAIAALGTPSAAKIPGAIKASRSGANIVIDWTGTVLESAPSLTGPWSTVTGAGHPYTVSAPAGSQFFRVRQ